MRRVPHRFAAVLALASSVVLGAPGAPSAQALQDGDIVVPGNHVVDGFGNVNGCFYRIRGGTVTKLFQSAQYRGPRDMMIDDQGRLVFFASPQSRNIYDTALFRIDPGTGALERLWYFPAYVEPADTLPQGAADVTNFGGASYQSLHPEPTFEVRIADDENGGWPQFLSDESYGFSIHTTAGAVPGPRTFRYHPGAGTCEPGIGVDLLPWNGAVYMAADGSDIYYGLHDLVGRNGVPAKLSLHFDGDWGTFDASLVLPPRNELVITGHVFDNTRYPNGTVNCGGNVDSDVPFTAGGSTFSVLSMDGLGVLDGSLYATSGSGATGTPYVFGLAPRAPYLNPYVCLWDTAIEGNGMLDFSLPDGTPTSAPSTSPDGDGLLGLGNGTIKRVTPGGGFQVIDASVPYSGRPWRWRGPGLRLAAASPPASGAQVLVVRVDSLVHLMLTDEAGDRIGFDSLGTAVNDFGESGQVPAPPASGWPRVFALRDPGAGNYTARVHATGPGDWSAVAYLTHESGARTRLATAGTAGASGGSDRLLHVGQPIELNWYADATAVTPGPAAGGFVSIGPIPARGPVRIAFRAPEAGAHARLDVFDLAGRRVATPVDAASPGGLNVVSWDGAGRAGGRLPPGVYLARLTIGGVTATRRIALLP